MSPTIRDPSLNTAECVIQGHKLDFATTERSIHIRVMLWLSMVFALCSGHVLAAFMKTLQKSSKNTCKAICFSFQVLSIVSILDILVALGYSIYYWVCYKPTFLDTAIILSLTIIVGASECFCQLPELRELRELRELWELRGLQSLGATAISYILCWLIIGIRINPTWGLTIALFVISVSAAVTFAAYIYLEVIHSNGNSNGTNGAGTNGDRSQDNSNGTAANSFVMSTIYCCCCCCCCHPNRQSNGTNGAGTNGENARDNSNDTAANSSAAGTINCCCRCCCYRHRNGNSNGTDGAGTNSDSGQYNGNGGTDASSYLINRNRRNAINSTDQGSTKRTFFICAVGCFAVVSLFVIVVLAGHANSGKEMAVDEVLKAISLYFLTAFLGWVTLNSDRPDASQHSAVRNAPPTSHERPPRHRTTQRQTTPL